MPMAACWQLTASAPYSLGTTQLFRAETDPLTLGHTAPQVIMLSYFNVKKAMDHYISKGGSAKFIICDDGFQVGRPRPEAVP